MQGVYPLVLSVPFSVKEIARLGLDFPWQKPECCPHCRSGLWWHGFVVAYFSCQPDPLYLRRLFCPCCKAVHRLKPSGFYRRFRSTAQEIRDSITHRFVKGRWRPDLPRERQRGWWRRLGRMSVLMLGVSFSGSPPQAFSLLEEQNIIPVTSAGLQENQNML